MSSKDTPAVSVQWGSLSGFNLVDSETTPHFFRKVFVCGVIDAS